MIYEFEGCRLDAATQELWRDGELVHIEPQVLAVLEYLVGHPDRVVTKIELLDEVWGDRFVSESALTSRIKLARKACGDSGREQRIVKTVHGRGYRVVAEVRTAAGAVDGQVSHAPPRSTPSPELDRIVGRSAELALLDDAVAATQSRVRGAVFVTGELGTGKSLLVAEMQERIDDPAGWLVLRGRCLRGRGSIEPYFSLLDAFADLSRAEPDLVRDALDRVAPSWLVQIPSLVDDELAGRLERRLLGSAPNRMLREGADAIEELARRRATLVLLEDLQWADDSTLDVLDLVTRRREPIPLLVVTTARDDAGAHRELIAGAAASGLATEIRLGALDRAAIADLVRSRFGGAVPDDVVDIVADRCDGIPLFAHEIASTLLRQGLVTEEVTDDGPTVTLSGTIDECRAAIPDTLLPLIERELETLTGDERRAIEAAAVAGVEFDGAMVAAGLELPVADAEALLSDLGRRLSYIVPERGATWPDGTVSTAYSFTHRLYRDVVDDRTSPGLRSALHGRIGLAIEAGHVEDLGDVSAVLAHHFTEAGDTGRSIEYLRRSGERAASRDAHGRALELLESALRTTSRLPPGDGRDRAEVAVRIALGPVLVATRGWIDPSVEENYRRALALCAGREPCPEAAAARYGLATVTELQGQFARTEELLSPLLDAEATGTLAMEAHELVACSTFHQGAFVQSLENADMVLDSWDEEAYSVPMSRIAEHPASSCNSWASLSAWCLGRPDESLANAERAVALGERNRYALTTALQQRAMLHQLRNEPEACELWASRTREVGGEQDYPMRVIQGDIYRGWALSVTGSVDEGLPLIEDGLARFRHAGARLNEAYYLGLQGDALLHADRPNDALAALDSALSAMRAGTRSYFFESELHRLVARAHVARRHDGWLDAARRSLDESAAVAEAQRSPALVLRTTADRFDLEREHGDPVAWRGVLEEAIASIDARSRYDDVERANALLTS